MKIRIIGNSGSGKTYLAQRLSQALSLPAYDLDELFWNNAQGYGQKRNEAERKQLLQTILSKEDWIIEGVYYAWCKETLQQADLLLLLCPPLWLCRLRIIKRHIARCRQRSSKKESWRNVYELLLWTNRFQKQNLPKILTLIDETKEKTIILSTKKDEKQLQAKLFKHMIIHNMKKEADIDGNRT